MRPNHFAIPSLLLAALLCQCHQHAEQAAPRADKAEKVEVAPPRPATSADAADASPPATEQRFPLRDGRTAVVGPEDHVVILSTDGGEEGESFCGANGISYRRAVTFFTQVVGLVRSSDKSALAELVTFPLRASTPIKTRADFIAQYERLFTPSETAAITHADPAEIFCKNGAFMLGDGELWAAPDEHGEYRLTTVNPPVAKAHHAAAPSSH